VLLDSELNKCSVFEPGEIEPLSREKGCELAGSSGVTRHDLFRRDSHDHFRPICQIAARFG
jgi:hypothetical protein